MHFDPNSSNISIGNEILEIIGNDCVNKYFKFVGLKHDEFLNWDFQIKHIRLLVYNSLVRPHIEYGIVTWGGVKNSELQIKNQIFAKKDNQSG